MKKALLIAIQYKDTKDMTDSVLQSSHGDILAFRKLLIDQYGYSPRNIKLLMDCTTNESASMGLSDYVISPTHNNIMREMRNLVKGAQPGDHFTFNFSGHGDQVGDTNGDEQDELDEVVYPSDICNPFTEQVQNYILDDDIFEILVNSLPERTQMTMVFDCCRSGTAGDLPWVFSSEMSRSPKFQPRSPQWLRAFYNRKGIKVTSWSACRDDQQTLGGTKPSIFTEAMVKALESNPHQDYRALLTAITEKLRYMTNGINDYLTRTTPQCPLYDIPIPQIGYLEEVTDAQLSQPVVF